MKLGDIYMVDFNPARGSEQAGYRPALIIQNDVVDTPTAKAGQVWYVSVKYIRKRQIHSDVNYNKSGSSTPSISQRALLTAILKSSSRAYA
jgi:mRNA-degrading endonuclease toxin of MazEF toxin-antitoxin module